jgi:8-oxo-dGTP pyrophosphatase MutT (NUDIX family)
MRLLNLFDAVFESNLAGETIIESDWDHQQALNQTGFWGRRAAGALFIALDTGRLGLDHRSAAVLEPGTWGVSGGAIDPNEKIQTALAREVMEELGVNISNVPLEPLDVFEAKGFSYTTFLAPVPHEFKVTHTSWESDGFEWFAFDELPDNLHPGVRTTLAKPQVQEKIRSMIKLGFQKTNESQIEETYSMNNQYLLKYLKAREIDPYSFWNEFAHWVGEKQNEIDDDEDAEHIVKSVRTALRKHTGNKKAILNPAELSEEDPELYMLLPKDVRDEFETWVRDEHINYMMQHDPAEAPTWAHLDVQTPKLLNRQTWLIHFTDNPDAIAQHGFTIGMDQMDRLGLTTYYKNDGFDKKHGGYNFAFMANSRDANWAASQHKYGKHAVMFQSSGVHAYHYGDEENQVIYWGADVNPRSIVTLYDTGEGWAIPGIWRGKRQGNRDYVYKGDFQHAVAWVEQNYRQYEQLITQGLPPLSKGPQKR